MLFVKILIWIGMASALLGQIPVTDSRALLDSVEKLDGENGFKYRAGYIFYHQNGDSLVLRGNVQVSRGGAVLEADEMVYYRSPDILVARVGMDSSSLVGNLPVLKHDDEVLEGSQIIYDMTNGLGKINDGKIRRNKGYFTGNYVETHSDSEFDVHRGTYTTCDIENPHFDFYSPKIKVLVDDVAIARPVYFRIANRRIFWVPFFLFSLGDDRRSGLLTPGYGRRPTSYGSVESEWELSNIGYYYAPSDYWDLASSVDLRERSGWLGRMNVNYATRYRFNGRFDFRIENRQAGATVQRNWRLNFLHNQTIDEDSNIRASGALQNNTQFGLDNSSRLDERLNRTLRSNIGYSRRYRKSGNSVVVNVSQTRNLDVATQNFVFPEVSFRKSRKPLWGGEAITARERDSPWYSRIFYDTNARFKNLRRSTEFDTTSITSADIGMRVSAQYRPTKWLTINPSLQENWRNEKMREKIIGGVRSDRMNMRIAMSQTAYGLFRPRLGAVNALRHVFKPSVDLTYDIKNVSEGGIIGFGSRDGNSWEQNSRVNVRIDNAIWAKIHKNEEDEKLRLIQFNLSNGYDLRRQKTPLDDLICSVVIEGSQFFDSRFTLRSAWYDKLENFQMPKLRQIEVRTTARYSSDGKQEEIGGFNVMQDNISGERSKFGYERGLSSGIDLGFRRNLQISHYYSRTRTASDVRSRSWLRLGGSGKIGKAWDIHYSVNYNLDSKMAPTFSSKRVTSELLSIQRSFHDWKATLNIEPTNVRNNRAFYFKAQLIDIPQLKFERRDTRN
ncbi:MAG: putative LPS assembly protein LptD [Candidatus Latescibacterota bacterium]|nr:putative LPS assembly protein LptD [Candidatus Latescibacterota bacterium]